MIETVKDKTVAAIKGAGDVVQATVDAVTQILATAIKDTGKVEVGSTAVATVRKAVTKPINGVKVVLKEPEMAVSNN